MNTNAAQAEVCSSDGLERMSFAEHRDQTAADVDAVIAELQKLATQVREGDVGAFERWWFEGGTEEGDATMFKIRDLLILRFYWREERVAL